MRKTSINVCQNKVFGMALLALIVLTTGFINIAEANTMENNAQALTQRQKSIVAIAALTARGDLENLKTALNEGLDAGLTVNEIKEVLVQMYAYAGFPRSLNGISTFMTVMEERAQKGISDEAGPEAKPMPADLNRDEYGKNVRLQLTGRTEEAPPSGYQVFTPVIDSFLKEHLFADIFYRDILDHQSRELATIGALAGIGDVNPQLRSHLNIGFNTGLTEAQMRELVQVITDKVGPEQGANAGRELAAVIESRK